MSSIAAAVGSKKDVSSKSSSPKSSASRAALISSDSSLRPKQSFETSTIISRVVKNGSGKVKSIVTQSKSLAMSIETKSGGYI